MPKAEESICSVELQWCELATTPQVVVHDSGERRRVHSASDNQCCSALALNNDPSQTRPRNRCVGQHSAGCDANRIRFQVEEVHTQGAEVALVPALSAGKLAARLQCTVVLSLKDAIAQGAH
jgi:hypothetical protein